MASNENCDRTLQPAVSDCGRDAPDDCPGSQALRRRERLSWGLAYLGPDVAPSSSHSLPGPRRGPGVGWHGVGPQSVVSVHLPDGTATGGRPGAPQDAGTVPPLARPCCLAPVPYDL